MRISDWSSDVCSSDLFVEPAEAEIEAGLEGVCRLGGDVIDRAAGGVLPEKGALRAFERFDALEVQSSPSRHCNKRQGNLVDIDRNGGAGGNRIIDEANAAYRKDRVTVVALLVGETWHELGELRGIGDALLCKLFATCGGHRHRPVHQPDRKSVWKGKRVSVRGMFRGPRDIKTK